MRKLIVLPTWWFARLVRPSLPADHPWRPGIPDLDDWVRKSTDANILFGIIFWEFGLALVIACILWVTL